MKIESCEEVCFEFTV